MAAQRQTMYANLRRVRDAGIPIAMGTDAGNPLTLHGASVFREMEAMGEAGMTPMEVLVASTRNAARAMGARRTSARWSPGSSPTWWCSTPTRSRPSPTSAASAWSRAAGRSGRGKSWNTDNRQASRRDAEPRRTTQFLRGSASLREVLFSAHREAPPPER